MNNFRLALGTPKSTRNRPPKVPESFAVASSFDSDQNRLTLSLTEISTGGLPANLAVSTLTIDGQDSRAALLGSAAVSPELAATPSPGQVSGTDMIVSALTQAPQAGLLYLVSYEILSASSQTTVFFSSTSGPFAAQSLPATTGVHHILVIAAQADAASLLSVSGAANFGFVSCRKAQWDMTIPSATARELAADTNPGRIAGSPSPVTAPTEPLIPGAQYLLRYEITADGGTVGFFLNTNGPFAYAQLPRTVGAHEVTLTCEDADVGTICNVNGDLTFGSLSLTSAVAPSGDQTVAWTVAAGNLFDSGQVVVPAITPEDPQGLFVSPTGSDSTGDGSVAAPYRTPAAAIAAAVPGDTIYLRPGTYDPIIVNKSGQPGLPITITTLPGEERQAIVQGDLQLHQQYGGPGGPSAGGNIAWRSGVRIAQQTYIHIRNLTIQDCAYEGIYVLGGDEGVQYGHHVLSGNLTQRTGGPGIMVAGFPPFQGRRVNEAIKRIDDVIIEDNDVSFTNVVTDYNYWLTNGDDNDPGGVDECITVCKSAGNIVTRNNYIHDSRQYGIDYKGDVVGGAIYGNRIERIARYAIYIDSGRNQVTDLDIYDNLCSECNIGITLAREAASYSGTDPEVPIEQTLRNIRVFNNVVTRMNRSGIYCVEHPGDGPYGEISNISIRFNTVYDCAQETGNSVRLADWSGAAYQSAGIVSNFDFVGNLIYKSTGAAGYVNDFAGQPNFTVDDNLVDTNPMFSDPANQDFTLQTSSPARIVSASYATSPFDVDAGGGLRSSPAAAGAFDT